MATKRIPTLDDDDNIHVEFIPDVTTAPIATHTAASDPHGDRAFATSAVSTHTAATDPHGDRSFATSAVSTHTAASDPHGDRAFATAAIATHAAASDPHGDRAFATAAVSTHAAASDPHGDRAFATSAVSTHAAASDPHGDRAYAVQRVNHTGDTKQIQLIFDGDSITAGSQSTNGMTYPAQTVEGLESRATVTNVAVGGQAVTAMLADVVAQVDSMYSASKLNVVLVGGGTNDLFISGGSVTVDTLYANYVSYHTGRRALGFKTVAITLLPRTEVGTPANFEDKRQDFNTRVQTNWATFADALMDVGADATIGVAGASDNTTYFADKTHPTNAGYTIMARYARAALASLGVVGAHDHAQYQPVTRRLWLSADRFVAWSGTPVMDASAFRIPAMLFDPAADEQVTALVDLPRDWLTYTVDLYWANTAAGAGDVRWTINYNTNGLVDGATTTASTGTSFVVSTAGASLTVKKITSFFGTSLPAVSGALTQLRLMRFASNAADTLANDAAFLGMMLNKVT